MAIKNFSSFIDEDSTHAPTTRASWNASGRASVLMKKHGWSEYLVMLHGTGRCTSKALPGDE
eukprot:5210015-Amphidinium_carterae.1